MALIVGIDEVGRGAWAGPLMVGAVLLSEDKPILGLKDSKLLSKKQRELLTTTIYEQALACNVGSVESDEIDAIGLSAAMSLAIQRALSQIDAAYDQIVIDGNINYLPNDVRARCMVKADMLVPAVSAASIIAKTSRDRLMAEYAHEWPDHGFEKHVGYGTALHKARLDLHGITPLHRRSFKPVAAYGRA